MADAHAHGVNCIDTADVYSKGGSEAMVGELRKGQIRYLGVPNVRGWRLAEMMRLAGQFGMPEVEVLPACAHYRIGVAPHRPGTPGAIA